MAKKQSLKPGSRVQQMLGIYNLSAGCPPTNQQVPVSHRNVGKATSCRSRTLRSLDHQGGWGEIPRYGPGASLTEQTGGIPDTADRMAGVW